MTLNRVGRKILKRLRRNLGGKGARLQGGRYLYLLCPFHIEKTASCCIDVKEGLYYCFGCHKNGNIWQLAKKHPEILGKSKQRKMEPLPWQFPLSSLPKDDELPF